jgi:hypothetical protein
MASTRPRGYAPWKPRGTTLQVLHQVADVLDQYAEHLPLTGRQIFYRLVGAHGYAKTEAAYGRLLDYLNRARRAGLIPWSAIRDDGATTLGADRFGNGLEFLEACNSWARGLQLDLLQFQPQHVELWCEATGMAPQLAKVANAYGVTVRSSGGFDSTTTKQALAAFYSSLGKPVAVLHVGDLDPSGVHIVSALDQDLAAFMARDGGEVSVHRVAVTPEQQAAYGLATAPPKVKDGRSFELDWTVQAEALDPADLAAIVREAIEGQLDLGRHRMALERQEMTRQQVSAALAGVRL